MRKFMRIRKLLSLSFAFFLLGCNMFMSEEEKNLLKMNEKLINLNKKFKNTKIAIEGKLYDDVFEDKLEKSYSLLVYYDANCSICFSQLEVWKKNHLAYFQELDYKLNIKFILFSDDIDVTNINLEYFNFPKPLIVHDEKKQFIRRYVHAIDKAYNTMLLNDKNEIIFIGSPTLSPNLKKHYKLLIKNKIID